MNKTLSAFILLLSLSLAFVPAHAAPSVRATQAQTYGFAFRDAEIAQVTEEILGRGLGVAYRIEPGVTGKMNFRIEQRLTKTQLLAAFEAALASFDVVMTTENETIILRPRDKAQTGGRISTGNAQASGIGYQIRAVPINYGSASEIAKVLETLSKSNLVLMSSDKLGLILLGGRAEELDNALKSIELFDQSTLSEARIRFFPLSNASAKTVAVDLEKLLKESGTSSVTIAPMHRLNGIFAFSKSRTALDEIAAWVQRLDTPSSDPSIKVYVYHPRGASAQSLARTLNQVMGLSTGTGDVGNEAEQGTGSGSGSGSRSSNSSGPAGSDRLSVSSAVNNDPDSQIHIVADRDTNSIIINAPEAMRMRMLEILAEIDHEPAQVFIEAAILEVTLGDNFNYGVDWKTISTNGKLKMSSYGTSATTFSPIAPGFSVNYVGSDITAAITALSSQSKVRIVSAPKISAVENTMATLEIGDQVPIIKQTSQSTTANAPLVSTVDYRNTGVLLKVTPRISAQNRITIEVSQEVSSVAKTKTSGIDSPTINQRRMESRLIVPEGTVVALGGLISSSESDSDAGVPYVKDIPFLGSLFKGRSQTKDRTELVILLQAKIIRAPEDYQSILSVFNEDLHDMIKSGGFIAHH